MPDSPILSASEAARVRCPHRRPRRELAVPLQVGAALPPPQTWPGISDTNSRQEQQEPL